MSQGSLRGTLEPAAYPRRERLAGRYVVLEPFDPAADAPPLFAATHADDAGAAVWTWLKYGPFEDVSALEAWLWAPAASSDVLFFAIRPAEGGDPLGCIGLLNVVPERRALEIGHVWLVPRAQRGRSQTEATYLLLAEAQRLGYRRVEWRCNARNERSWRAAERLGFTFEGVLRQFDVSKGENRDTVILSLLDREWPARRAAIERWLYGDGPTISLSTMTRTRDDRNDLTSPEERLRAFAARLPAPVEPVADYLPVARAGDLLFVSGHASELRGAVGADLDVDEGQRAAGEAALGALASLRGHVGDLSRVDSIVCLTGYVRSAPDFTDQPAVVDGASALLREAFGERGRHARAALGVAQLPMGAAVEVTLVARLRSATGEDGEARP